MDDRNELLRKVTKLVKKHAATSTREIPFTPFRESEDDEDPPFTATFFSLPGQSFDLWLGSVSDSMYPRALKERNIVAILNMASGQCADIQRIERVAANGSQWERVTFNEQWYRTHLGVEKFMYLGIPAEDHPRYKISDDWGVCLEFFDKVENACKGMERRPGLLVHCIQGLNRSAAVCVALLVKRIGLSVLSAVDLVASRRPGVLSNRGFLKQLVAIETVTTPDVSVRSDKTFTIGDIVER